MPLPRFRLMAIDDEPKVLDAYSTLFAPNKKWLSIIADLADLENEPVEEDEFEFQLECYRDGESGVAALHQSLRSQDPIAVIFLDMRMPSGWSGLETAREIRKLDESVRIVMISAYADHSLKEIRAEIGSRFLFFSKPWKDEELLQLTHLLVSDWAYEQELQETRQALEEATETAVRANSAKDQFLASMSHELRTPLTAMLGYGELLEEILEGQEQHSLLKTMQVSGHTLLYLLNDILDLSKIAAGKFEIDQIEYDLESTLREVTQIFAVRAENQGLQFQLQHHPAGAEQTHMLVGDGKRVRQILMNLVSNAIKFTPAGWVRITIQSGADEIHFVVEDCGIGMKPEVVKRLFRPFEQADSSISGRFGGTGLGLHISQTLAQLMGGEISVESEPGKGSRFDLKLPLVTGAAKKRAMKHSTQSEEEGQLQGRVLLVEDTPELQLLISRMVQKLGLVVELAGHGQEALERVAQQDFDLILMDMQMPVMDGVEATRRLRSGGNSTPVVALTANVMQHQRTAFEEAGCNGFLSKPVQRAVLYRELQHHLKPATVELPPPELAPPRRAVVEMDAELKALFDERVREMREQLIQGQLDNDLGEVRSVVHTIKGSIGSFGYFDISEQAAEVERMMFEEGEPEFEGELNLLKQQLLDILLR